MEAEWKRNERMKGSAFRANDRGAIRGHEHATLGACLCVNLLLDINA